MYLNERGETILAIEFYNKNGNVPVDYNVIGKDCDEIISASGKDYCDNEVVSENKEYKDIKQWRYMGTSNSTHINTYDDSWANSFYPIMIFKEYNEPTIEFKLSEDKVAVGDEFEVDIIVHTEDLVDTVKFSLENDAFELVDIEYNSGWSNIGYKTDYVLNNLSYGSNLFGDVKVAKLIMKKISDSKNTDLITNIAFTTKFNTYINEDCSELSIPSLGLCISRSYLYDSGCAFSGHYSSSYYSAPYYNSGLYSSGKYQSSRYVYTSYESVSSGSCPVEYASGLIDVGSGNILQPSETIYTADTVKIDKDFFDYYSTKNRLIIKLNLKVILFQKITLLKRKILIQLIVLYIH